MGPFSIELRDLSKSFGSVQAIDALTLSFEPGLLHGIIGPDGAGKTTLFRLLAGLLSPDSGSMEYRAPAGPVAFDDVRETLAYMPSAASLYPDLTIAEHLEFFRRLYSMPDDLFRERSKELLRITRLERFSDRKVGQLSGGMYKKTGLMCALLRSPSVMLLDEPTNGVDPISRREFWELLYGLGKDKILVLISTAYMDEAERCAKVHFLDEGRMVLSGEPSALLAARNAKGFDDIFKRGRKP